MHVDADRQGEGQAGGGGRTGREGLGLGLGLGLGEQSCERYEVRLKGFSACCERYEGRGRQRTGIGGIEGLDWDVGVGHLAIWLSGPAALSSQRRNEE
jgi:hypothetical protein